MAFRKGKSGNADGRPKGAVNRTTAEAREIFNAILSDEMDHVREALATVRKKDAYKYLDLMNKLLAFYFPKAQTIDLGLSLTQLNDADIDRIINKILNNE